MAGNRSRKPRGPTRTEVRTLSPPPHANVADVIQWQKASAPPRSRRFDSCRPHHFARKADLVTAPRRKRGEVGSKPTPSASFQTDGMIAQQGEPPPRKRQTWVRVPLVPPVSFPSGEQGARGCLLSRVQAGSIPARGATCCRRLSRRQRQFPPVAQRIRAPVCGAGGRRFESCWVAHFVDDHQGVAQPGQSSALGMRRSQVRILSPCPISPRHCKQHRRHCERSEAISGHPDAWAEIASSRHARLAMTLRRVGRVARHRGANATRPKGRAGSIPALSATAQRDVVRCLRAAARRRYSPAIRLKVSAMSRAEHSWARRRQRFASACS